MNKTIYKVQIRNGNKNATENTQNKSFKFKRTQFAEIEKNENTP